MVRYFEDFSVGEQMMTPRRTVTESDVVTFAGLSGDYNPLHMDAVGAGETIFGQRIAHGLLGLSIASGLGARLGMFEESVIALLNVNWNFKGPIFLGDTIHARITVSKKRETSKPDRGVLTRSVELFKQDDTVVQQGTITTLVQRRPRQRQ